MSAVATLWDAFRRVSERRIVNYLKDTDGLRHLRAFPEVYGDISDDELAQVWLRERWPRFGDDFFEHAEEDGDKLVIYRCIGVGDPGEFAFMVASGMTDPKYTGIGIFWSWDKGRAECHWRAGEQEVLVQGRVALSAIDIERTLSINLEPDLGEMEAEIRLKEGARVEILGIGVKEDRVIHWIENDTGKPVVLAA